jgi:hypothetical protein
MSALEMNMHDDFGFEEPTTLLPSSRRVGRSRGGNVHQLRIVDAKPQPARKTRRQGWALTLSLGVLLGAAIGMVAGTLSRKAAFASEAVVPSTPHEAVAPVAPQAPLCLPAVVMTAEPAKTEATPTPPTEPQPAAKIQPRTHQGARVVRRHVRKTPTLPRTPEDSATTSPAMDALDKAQLEAAL